jgi:hypothetical protein
MTSPCHGLFLISNNYIEHLEREMSKNTSPNKDGAQPLFATDASVEVALTPFWLLNSGTAKKLGQNSTSILNYHVLADNGRRGLFLAVTRNEGGGYFSRERVPFRTIVTCVDKYKSGVPFVSKALKDVFISKSANNAGFMAAVLRALGLLAPAPEAKTQHVVTGDWSSWERTMLAETGTRIELPAENGGGKPTVSDTIQEEKQHKKTLEILAKKPQ